MSASVVSKTKCHVGSSKVTFSGAASFTITRKTIHLGNQTLKLAECSVSTWLIYRNYLYLLHRIYALICIVSTV